MTVRVFLQSPLLKEMVVFTVTPRASAEEIKDLCLSKVPEHLRSEDLIVFDEAEAAIDSDEGEFSGQKSEKDSKETGNSRRMHLGRCKCVHVKVRYAGQAVERDFKPATTIGRVTKWATHKLGIAPHDANELVLQLAGSEVQPPRDQHVGCLVGDSCEVIFDLVRGYTVNGDGQVSPEHARLLEHLESGPFLSGVELGNWSMPHINWPFVLLDVRARNGDIFTLRLLCDGYPKQAPTGTFWDTTSNEKLPAQRWPRSGARVGQALRVDWQGGTALYIPCDRLSIAGHDQWVQLYPAWIWDPTVGLTRYVEVVWYLLNGDDYVSPNA